MKAIISSFESFATLDGNGLRLAIFFQGCPLRCWCCHNPETWKIATNKTSCCKEKDNLFSIKKLIKKVERNELYFGINGGVTLSGGEPLVQSNFLVKFCKKLKKRKINITLDTSGVILNKKALKVVKLCDEIILDLKFANSEEYLKYTSASFENVISFLNLLETLNKQVVVKSVIIPGINDSKEYIKKYVKILKNYKCVKNYELLAFHTLGFKKYEDLKLENKLKGLSALKSEKLIELQKHADKLLTN